MAKLSRTMDRVIELAKEMVRVKYPHYSERVVGTEHILLAILEEGRITTAILRESGVDVEALRIKLREEI